ncbi:MAG: DNA-directed RNA polymerase subunit omega [Defluviitaleaceae bacterium]|nr:DNA-directed RNA polymerase subunit omega [Defluviitaleaceae bacterium]
MLNPSYSSLISILNQDANADQRITSRYSIVIAAAKRARQIVAGAEYQSLGVNSDKAVSIAINEIQHGHVKIVPGSVEAWNLANVEQIPQNMPVVIDDGFVSEDTASNYDNDDEDAAVDYDQDGDWDEDNEDSEDDDEDDNEDE